MLRSHHRSTTLDDFLSDFLSIARIGTNGAVGAASARLRWVAGHGGFKAFQLPKPGPGAPFDRRAGALSGGQGKMAALARALVTGTRLLLLDEPFQGLAPALARRYGEILARLVARERGLALLVSESNPELLAPFVDQVITIERGELMQDG